MNQYEAEDTDCPYCGSTDSDLTTYHGRTMCIDCFDIAQEMRYEQQREEYVWDSGH